MISPIKALVEFHQEYCSDVSINSPVIIFRLLNALVKKEKENEENEK